MENGEALFIFDIVKKGIYPSVIQTYLSGIVATENADYRNNRVDSYGEEHRRIDVI